MPEEQEKNQETGKATPPLPKNMGDRLFVLAIFLGCLLAFAMLVYFTLGSIHLAIGLAGVVGVALRGLVT